MASTAYQGTNESRAERGTRTRNEAEHLASALPPLLVDAEQLASLIHVERHVFAPESQA